MQSLSAKEAFGIVCPVLEKQYQQHHGSILAKLKMLKLIQEGEPVPSRFEEAWASIQASSQTQASAIAELVIELQNLLEIGHPSKLW
jgi:hypothetical protein